MKSKDNKKKPSSSKKDDKSTLVQLQAKLKADLEKWGKSLEESAKSYDLDQDLIKKKISADTTELEAKLPKALRAKQKEKSKPSGSLIMSAILDLEKKLDKKAADTKKQTQSFQKDIENDVVALKNHFEALQNSDRSDFSRLEHKIQAYLQQLETDLKKNLLEKESELISLHSNLKNSLEEIENKLAVTEKSSSKGNQNTREAFETELLGLQKTIKELQVKQQENQDWVREKFQRTTQDFQKTLLDSIISSAENYEALKEKNLAFEKSINSASQEFKDTLQAHVKSNQETNNKQNARYQDLKEDLLSLKAETLKASEQLEKELKNSLIASQKKLEEQFAAISKKNVSQEELDLLVKDLQATQANILSLEKQLSESLKKNKTELSKNTTEIASLEQADLTTREELATLQRRIEETSKTLEAEFLDQIKKVHGKLDAELATVHLSITKYAENIVKRDEKFTDETDLLRKQIQELDARYHQKITEITLQQTGETSHLKDHLQNIEAETNRHIRAASAENEESTKNIRQTFEKQIAALETHLNEVTNDAKRRHEKLQFKLEQDFKTIQTAFEAVESGNKESSVWFSDQLRIATEKFKKEFLEFTSKYDGLTAELNERFEKKIEGLARRVSEQTTNTETALELFRNTLSFDLEQLKKQILEAQKPSETNQAWIKEQIQVYFRKATEHIEDVSLQNQQKIKQSERTLQSGLNELQKKLGTLSESTEKNYHQIQKTFQNDIKALSVRLDEFENTKEQDRDWVRGKIDESASHLQKHFSYASTKTEEAIVEIEKSIQKRLGNLDEKVQDLFSKTSRTGENLNTLIKEELEPLKEELELIKSIKNQNYSWVHEKLNQKESFLKTHAENLYKENADAITKLESMVQEKISELNFQLKNQDEGLSSALNLASANLQDNLKALREQFDALKAAGNTHLQSIKSQIEIIETHIQTKLEEVATKNQDSVELLDSLVQEKLFKFDQRIEDYDALGIERIDSFEESLRGEILEIKRIIENNLLDEREERQKIKHESDTYVHRLQQELQTQAEHQEQLRLELQNQLELGLSNLKKQTQHLSFTSEDKINESQAQFKAELGELRNALTLAQSRFAADQTNVDEKIKLAVREVAQDVSHLTQDYRQSIAHFESIVASTHQELKNKIEELELQANLTKPAPLPHFQDHQVFDEKIKTIYKEINATETSGHNERKQLEQRITQLATTLRETRDHLQSEQNKSKNELKDFMSVSVQNLKLLKDDLHHRFEQLQNSFYKITKTHAHPETVATKREYLISQIKDISDDVNRQIARVKAEQTEVKSSFDKLRQNSEKSLIELRDEITQDLIATKDKLAQASTPTEIKAIKIDLNNLTHRFDHLNVEFNEIVANVSKERQRTQEFLTNVSKNSENSLGALRVSMATDIRKMHETIESLREEREEERGKFNHKIDREVKSLEDKTDTAIRNLEMNLSSMENTIADKVSRLEKFVLSVSDRVPFSEQKEQTKSSQTVASKLKKESPKLSPTLTKGLLKFKANLPAGFSITGFLVKVLLFAFIVTALYSLISHFVENRAAAPTLPQQSTPTRELNAEIPITTPRDFGYDRVIAEKKSTVLTEVAAPVTAKEKSAVESLKSQAIEEGSREAYEALKRMASFTKNESIMNDAYDAIRETEQAIKVKDPIAAHTLLYDYNEGNSLRNRHIPATRLLEVLSLDNDWKDRAKAARYLGSWNSQDIRRALARAAKEDSNLYVIKESLKSFQKQARVEFGNPLDAGQAEAWLQLNQ